ncbi:hypothetical protein [Sinorhizobium meliloti]|uniref:hypothetical protein n=1 Tax=Rhizobium meliloti TaxID=382 RepID=UPI0039890F52
MREGLFDFTQSRDAKAAAFAADYLERIDATGDEEGGSMLAQGIPELASVPRWPHVSGSAKNCWVSGSNPFQGER